MFIADDESGGAAVREEGPKKIKTLGGGDPEMAPSSNAPKPATPAAITRWELDLSESSDESDGGGGGGEGGGGGGASRPKKPKLVKKTRPAAATGAVRKPSGGGAVTRFIALKGGYSIDKFLA